MSLTRLASAAAFALLSSPLLLLNLMIISSHVPTAIEALISLSDLRVLIDVGTASLSLVLLTLAIVMSSSLMYALALIIHIIRDPALVVFEPIYLLPVFVSPLLVTVGRIWRSGQSKSIKIESVQMISTMAALILILLVATYVSIQVGGRVWEFLRSMRHVEISSPAAEPIVELLLRNPIGYLLIVIASLFVLYKFFVDVGETAVLFLRPSRGVAIEAIKASIDFESPFQIPLASLRNMIISLSISPPIYYLVITSLTRLEIELPYMYEMGLKFVTALLIFGISWFMISRLLSRIDEAEPGLSSVIAGAAMIVLVYLLSYMAALWSPEQGLSLAEADAYISKILTEYYGTFLVVGEALLMVVGAVP